MGTEKVAVIGGTGDLGYGLGLRWAGAGIEIVIGSRDAARAKSTAKRVAEATGGTASGAENAEAAASASIVVLAVPFAAQSPILKSIKPALKDCIYVDATVPLATAIGGRPTRMLGIWEGSAAEAARAIVPKDIPVLAAFHNVSAAMLKEPPAPLDCDVLVCGDDDAAKERLSALIALIPGLRAVDAGPLENARIVEAITALLISLNRRHKVPHSGIRITGLPEENTL